MSVRHQYQIGFWQSGIGRCPVGGVIVNSLALPGDQERGVADWMNHQLAVGSCEIIAGQRIGVGELLGAIDSLVQIGCCRIGNGERAAPGWKRD